MRGDTAKASVTVALTNALWLMTLLLQLDSKLIKFKGSGSDLQVTTPHQISVLYFNRNPNTLGFFHSLLCLRILCLVWGVFQNNYSKVHTMYVGFSGKGPYNEVYSDSYIYIFICVCVYRYICIYVLTVMGIQKLGII